MPLLYSRHRYGRTKTIIRIYSLKKVLKTKHTWREMLEDLINRGLKMIMIIVSDDLVRIGDVINLLFLQTDLKAYAFVHLQRNV